MPRERFQTLTEQMFYILLCLQNECCGMDMIETVRRMTGGWSSWQRITGVLLPGRKLRTLYMRMLRRKRI